MDSLKLGTAIDDAEPEQDSSLSKTAVSITHNATVIDLGVLC